MSFSNNKAPEGTACSNENTIVTRIEYKDGRVEHPWDDELRNKIVIGQDGKPRSPYLEARAFFNSDKGVAAIKKAIQEGKAFPAD